MAFSENVGGALIILARWQAAWHASFNVMQLFGSLEQALSKIHLVVAQVSLWPLYSSLLAWQLRMHPVLPSYFLEQRWLRDLVLG
jgi:hypothetical protein